MGIIGFFALIKPEALGHSKQCPIIKFINPHIKLNMKRIIYSGPSKIDGSPIVAVYIAGSANSKTGSMSQVFILQADIDPITANRTGVDYGICGNCPHRGKADPNKVSGFANGRSCYVNLGQGPRAIYKAFKAGKYQPATLDELPAIGAGQMIRLGAYGDPLAVPSHIFRALLSKAKGHTSYTHASGILPDATLSPHMVSADNPEQAQEAHSKGLRTFRVIPLKQWQDKGRESLLPNEILCPASKEAGAKVQCLECGLCAGQTIKAKSIAIPAHGIGKNHVKG